MERNDKNKKFNWKIFWITIGVLIGIYVVLIALGNMNMLKHQKKKVVLEEVIAKIQKENPQFANLIENLDKEAKNEIAKYIYSQVNELYKPVYEHLDAFVNYHYSLKGEYSEIIAAATNNLGDFIYTHIYKPANFDENYQKMMSDINSKVKEIASREYDKLKEGLKKYNLDEEESDALLTKILNYSKEDMIKRYENFSYNSLRGLGIAGGVSGALLAKVLAKKIIQKIAIKTGAKVAVKGASIAAGATAGAESGLLCGPGAVLCSSIGAVIGGVIGWIASDKIVLEIDKALNSEKFKKDVYNMVTNQKNQFTRTLIYAYAKGVDEVNKELQKSFEELKTKPIKEIIIH